MTHTFHTAGLGGLPAITNGEPTQTAPDPFGALQKEIQDGIKMVQQSFSNKKKNSNKSGGKQGDNENKKNASMALRTWSTCTHGCCFSSRNCTISSMGGSISGS